MVGGKRGCGLDDMHYLAPQEAIDFWGKNSPTLNQSSELGRGSIRTYLGTR